MKIYTEMEDFWGKKFGNVVASLTSYFTLYTILPNFSYKTKILGPVSENWLNIVVQHEVKTWVTLPSGAAHLGGCSCALGLCWCTELWGWRACVQGWHRGLGGSARRLKVVSAAQAEWVQYEEALWFQSRRSPLTGGFGLFFLFVADLEPENRLLRAANAALALATFLLGPVPRNTCLSTSTCHNTELNSIKAAF